MVAMAQDQLWVIFIVLEQKAGSLIVPTPTLNAIIQKWLA